ncbi:carbohydrate-binding family 9-like protein [Paenibacillus aquistagni]|uniref:Carbohydrate family 9 binding domain-like n=1 Tax=Paenibacillus aquistagni TaxID=1852522 RepID=A0A1X7LD44_9BACL|nr:carbohydrate-binding family 9-like protein [Paenibacillus aquistagni]SMG51778.1 Carbohydrate family 9 binding domain-like [Paenibacillus aquistagni]
MNRSGMPEPNGTFNPKHYICHRAQGPLELDGRLDKPFWESAPWTDDFVDIEGDLKPHPWKRTRVKMLWDDEYMYFGSEMEEDEIWATLTERDSVIFYDNDFEIFIDPDGDTHNYYEFEINALNTVWDLMLPKPYRDGGPPINGWDIQGLKTAVHIEGELNNPQASNKKWTLEVAMPWSSLKEAAFESRKPNAGEYWRVNFSRVEWHVDIVDGQYVKRINPETNRSLPEENWVWSPQGVINMHYPEMWGFVLFSEQNVSDSSNDEQRFILPRDEQIKWELRKLYYRERNYYEANGKFSSSFEELRGTDEWSIEPVIEVTSGLFQITAAAEDGKSKLIIREDGKTWREA